jgi:hypothetical protein
MSNAGMCVSLSTVKVELRQLLKEALKTGNKRLQKTLADDLETISGPGTKRMRIGGGDKMCHALTTAMFMTSGAAITYLTYMNVLPSVLSMVPRPCAGTGEQILGYVLSIVDPKSSCSARQAAWDKFTKAVFASAGLGIGQETYFGLGRKGVAKLNEAYDTVFEFNKKHVCGHFENVVSSTKRGVCAPFKALYRGLKGAKEVFDLMHGVDSPHSASSSGKSTSRERKRATVEADTQADSDKKLSSAVLPVEGKITVKSPTAARIQMEEQRRLLAAKLGSTAKKSKSKSKSKSRSKSKSKSPTAARIQLEEQRRLLAAKLESTAKKSKSKSKSKSSSRSTKSSRSGSSGSSRSSSPSKEGRRTRRQTRTRKRR